MIKVSVRLVHTVDANGRERLEAEERSFGSWNAAANFIDSFFRAAGVADFEKLNISVVEDVRRVAPGA